MRVERDDRVTHRAPGPQTTPSAHASELLRASTFDLDPGSCSSSPQRSQAVPVVTLEYSKLRSHSCIRHPASIEYRRRSRRPHIQYLSTQSRRKIHHSPYIHTHACPPARLALRLDPACAMSPASRSGASSPRYMLPRSTHSRSGVRTPSIHPPVPCCHRHASLCPCVHRRPELPSANLCPPSAIGAGHRPHTRRLEASSLSVAHQHHVSRPSYPLCGFLRVHACFALSHRRPCNVPATRPHRLHSLRRSLCAPTRHVQSTAAQVRQIPSAADRIRNGGPPIFGR